MQRAVIGALVLLLSLGLSLGARAGPGSLEDLERELRLTPAQKAQFDVALAATQRAMLSVGLAALQMKLRLGQELLKDRPDPRALAEAQEQLVEQNRPLFDAARAEWAALYALLDDSQVQVARAYIEEKLRRLERVGEALRGYLSGG